MEPDGDVSFGLAIQSGDFVFAPGGTDITVNTAGVYKVEYSLLLRPDDGVINAAYSVTIGGTEHPLSFFGTFIDGAAETLRHQLTGMFLAEIPAGAVLTLRNESATADLLAGTGVDNQAVNRAAITLVRVG